MILWSTCCTLHCEASSAVVIPPCHADVMLCCRPGSPLWDLSVDDLLLQEMEVMVFFEGIDAMTSNSVQVSKETAVMAAGLHQYNRQPPTTIYLSARK